MKLVALRIVVDGLVPLEPTVHAHEADAIFDAWLGDAAEIVIPAANGAELPLAREEISTIEDGVGKTNILKMHWCGEEQCAREVETILDLTILGHPPEESGGTTDETCVDGSGKRTPGPGGPCVHCGKPTSTVIYASKTY